MECTWSKRQAIVVVIQEAKLFGNKCHFKLLLLRTQRTLRDHCIIYISKNIAGKAVSFFVSQRGWPSTSLK